MSTHDSYRLWSPRRRRAFYGLAAALSLAAAGMYAAMGVSSFISQGFDADLLESGAACALFLAGAALVVRDAGIKQPAAS